jgi:homocysteine S-methyltransferase
MGRHLERIEATRKGPSPNPAARSLHYAIDQVDQAMAGYPTYYRINCAHPRHLDSALADAGLWRDRVYG